MAHNIPDTVLSDLSHLLADKLGLHFPSEKWSDLERGIKGVSRLHHFNDPIECIDWLKNIQLTQLEIERLACYFTVGETYFFRDTGSFEALEKHILPGLIQLGRDKGNFLRIWSAGCSTGEEPYSIAILLSRLITDISDWNITLLASDINIVALNRLQEGLYSEWSFRTTPDEIKAKYFKRKENHRYEILPYLKKLVTPIYINLAEDTYPSLLNNTNAMDLIFCRNTLMYFEEHQAKKVITKFKQSLVDGGYFLVGASEHFQVQASTFKALNYHDAIIHQKRENLSDDRDALVSMVPLKIEVELESEPKPEFILPILGIKPDESIVLPSTLNLESQIIDQKNLQKIELEETTFQNNSEQADPQNIELIARSLANQGKLKEALVTIEEAICLDKCNPIYRYLKALILQELGNLNDAILELKKSIYLDPDYVLPYFSLANIARYQSKAKDADKYFSIVLSLLKNYSEEDIMPGSDGMTAGRMMESLALVDKGKKVLSGNEKSKQ